MPDIRLQDYVVKIKELIRNVRLDEAIAHCQHILRHYPKHIETYSLLGEACLEKQMYREAIEFFQRTLGADPENLIARVGLGVIYDEQGAFPEAIWQLERAFELVPGNAEVRRELLRLYGQYDEIDKTRLKLTRGALGRLYSRNGLYERAISEFRAVLRQDPDLPDIRVALVDALWREGRQVEAVEMCLELLDDLPNCLKANLILGDIWLRGGDEESAQQRLRVARALDPEGRVAQELMGKDSPLSPEEVLIPELDAIPDDFEFGPTDVLAAEAVEIVAVEELAEEAEPWGADEELPEWLRDVGVTAEEPALDLTEEAVPELATDELLPTEEMPEWLQEVMGEEGLAPAGEFMSAEEESVDEDLTAEEEAAQDIEYLESPELADAAATATGAGLASAAALAGGLAAASLWGDEEEEESVEAETTGEDMPEWLQDLVGEAAPSPDDVTDLEVGAFAGLAVAEIEEEPEFEEEALPADETLDWQQDLDAAQIEEIVAPAYAEAEEEPGFEAEALPADEIPDWLRDLDAAEVEEIGGLPVAEEAEEETVAVEAEALEGDEMPDWLRDLGVAEAEEEGEAQPVAELETVEISGLSLDEGEEEVVTEAVPLIDEIPDWLRDLDAVEVEEISSPPVADSGERVVRASQVPASLQALVAAGLLDEADIESAMAEMSEDELAAQMAEDVPDWLKDLVEEEEPTAIESAAEAAEPAGVQPVKEVLVEEFAVETVELEPEEVLVVEEAVVEAFEPELEAAVLIEEGIAEAVEPEAEEALVVEEAVAEVVEAEPEAEVFIEEVIAEAVEPEAEEALAVEEVMAEAAEPEPEAEEALAVEEAVAEAAEPEPEAAVLIEEVMAEAVEPEAEEALVVEEVMAEAAELEPEEALVVEEAVAEVFEPEPEAEEALVVEEVMAEAVEPEPEEAVVVEEAMAEAAEPEPEVLIEEVMAEAVEPEPEVDIAVEEAIVEAEEKAEAPSRADELLKQLKTRPRDYSARLELARLHYTEQEWDRALANYEKLISARRFLPDVVDDLEALADQGVEPARVYHMLGDAYMQQDQLDEALEMYRLARQKLTKR
jgi:tetratricopeptide (TPR) repeat protein